MESATGVSVRLSTGISPGVSLALSVGRWLDGGAPATGLRTAFAQGARLEQGIVLSEGGSRPRRIIPSDPCSEY